MVGGWELSSRRPRLRESVAVQVVRQARVGGDETKQ